MTTHNDAPTVAPQQCGLPEGLDVTDMDLIRRGDMLGPALGARAASLIQSQAAESAADKARIGELEAALEPFAAIADTEDEVGRDDPDDDRVWVVQAHGCQIGDLTIEDFRAARSLLNEERKG